MTIDPRHHHVMYGMYKIQPSPLFTFYVASIVVSASFFICAKPFVISETLINIYFDSIFFKKNQLIDLEFGLPPLNGVNMCSFVFFS
mgnify:CR=1 FL=1